MLIIGTHRIKQLNPIIFGPPKWSYLQIKTNLRLTLFSFVASTSPPHWLFSVRRRATIRVWVRSLDTQPRSAKYSLVKCHKVINWIQSLSQTRSRYLLTHTLLRIPSKQSSQRASPPPPHHAEDDDSTFVNKFIESLTRRWHNLVFDGAKRLVYRVRGCVCSCMLWGVLWVGIATLGEDEGLSIRRGWLATRSYVWCGSF